MVSSFHCMNDNVGINVIGYLRSNTGLGVAGRALTQLLCDKGCHVALNDDFYTGIERIRIQTSNDKYFVSSIAKLPYKINLLCLTLSHLHEFILNCPLI